jgi:hypothetical protein
MAKRDKTGSFQCGEDRQECSPTLPSKLDSPGNDLAGLLTYTLSELERLPGSNAASGWDSPCSVLGAYSYGVVADFHRLPEHQMFWTIESAMF